MHNCIVIVESTRVQFSYKYKVIKILCLSVLNNDNTLVHKIVTGEKNSIHQCRGRESNPGRLPDRPTLYHVAIKAALYRKAV